MAHCMPGALYVTFSPQPLDVVFDVILSLQFKSWYFILVLNAAGVDRNVPGSPDMLPSVPRKILGTTEPIAGLMI